MSSLPDTLTYVTGNAGKYRVAEAVLNRELPGCVCRQYAGDIVEIQADTQKDVALDKARKAYREVQKPVLVDDAGLFLDAYPGFPGVNSKFVAHHLGVMALEKLVGEGAGATFRVTIVFYDGQENPRVFEGNVRGTLSFHHVAHDMRLMYNTIFVPEGSSRTYAELNQDDPLRKENCRVAALCSFAAWYKQQYGV